MTAFRGSYTCYIAEESAHWARLSFISPVRYISEKSREICVALLNCCMSFDPLFGHFNLCYSWKQSFYRFYRMAQAIVERRVMFCVIFFKDLFLIFKMIFISRYWNLLFQEHSVICKQHVEIGCNMWPSYYVHFLFDEGIKYHLHTNPDGNSCNCLTENCK